MHKSVALCKCSYKMEYIKQCVININRQLGLFQHMPTLPLAVLRLFLHAGLFSGAKATLDCLHHKLHHQHQSTMDQGKFSKLTLEEVVGLGFARRRPCSHARHHRWCVDWCTGGCLGGTQRWLCWWALLCRTTTTKRSWAIAKTNEKQVPFLKNKKYPPPPPNKQSSYSALKRRHTLTQQQRPESPAVTLTWHVHKYEVSKFHHRYSLVCRFCTCLMTNLCILTSCVLMLAVFNWSIKCTCHGLISERVNLCILTSCVLMLAVFNWSIKCTCHGLISERVNLCISTVCVLMLAVFNWSIKCTCHGLISERVNLCISTVCALMLAVFNWSIKCTCQGLISERVNLCISTVCFDVGCF